jgi:lipoate-protein ligase A
MLFVDNEGKTDPRVNLAIEEHLLRNVQVDEPLLLFYINEPSVIIGRNQNTVEEIDSDYINNAGVHVVRRLSGGGAVYHDLGNLNFSFVTPGREGLHDFDRFTSPVIDVLRRLGVEAELRGSSDIFAAGKKISGNAQYAASGRMFSHGTLLFDTNIKNMLRALNPRQVRIESKAVQSVRNFVTNIRELMAVDTEINELKSTILEGIFGGPEIAAYRLSSKDWQRIRQVSADRYASWDWNYGRSPKFNVQKSEVTPAGKIDVRIDVEQGRIQGVKIYGNFSGSRDVSDLERHLVGVRYDRGALASHLQTVEVDAFFGSLEPEALLELLF